MAAQRAAMRAGQTGSTMDGKKAEILVDLWVDPSASPWEWWVAASVELLAGQRVFLSAGGWAESLALLWVAKRAGLSAELGLKSAVGWDASRVGQRAYPWVG